ncbi:MAG: hypothetical protein Q4A54_12280 [Parabacteroides sp.]|nr:hypothetical protein [Parabacteroides sp.]
MSISFCAIYCTLSQPTLDITHFAADAAVIEAGKIADQVVLQFHF